MHDLLLSKNYIFPPVSSDEIDAMVGLELQTLRTKESLEEEEKAVLETKLEYYLWRGGANDIKKANEIMKQMIELQVRRLSGIMWFIMLFDVYYVYNPIPSTLIGSY